MLDLRCALGAQRAPTTGQADDCSKRWAPKVIESDCCDEALSRNPYRGYIDSLHRHCGVMFSAQLLEVESRCHAELATATHHPTARVEKAERPFGV